jgi:hypothetical protein
MFNLIKSLFSAPLLPSADIPPPAREDAPRIFARLFSGDDGQKVLSYLRMTVNARVAGPEAEESALRYYDGQRGLLQTINGLIEQGKN